MNQLKIKFLKNNFSLLILSLLLFSCNTQKTISKINYFEGIITYDLEYLLKDDRFSESQLKNNIGAKMKLYFKNGNYLKQFYSSQGELLSETCLNLNENKSFNKQIGNDTIYWMNIRNNDSKTTFTQKQDSIICNEPTIVLKTKTTITGPGFKNNSYNVTGELHFSKNLKVNPLWYQYYLEGNFNEQIKIGKGMQLLYINNGPFWTKRTTATLIEHKKLKSNDIFFKLERNSILKEL